MEQFKQIHYAIRNGKYIETGHIILELTAQDAADRNSRFEKSGICFVSVGEEHPSEFPVPGEEVTDEKVVIEYARAEPSGTIENSEAVTVSPAVEELVASQEPVLDPVAEVPDPALAIDTHFNNNEI